MKKTILLLLALFCVSMSAQVLTVGSYNIRYQNNGDSIKGNGWQERYSVLCNQIVWEQPDIFGAQEVLYSQLTDLSRGLKDYKWIGEGRDDGDRDGEHCAIFYNAKRIKLIKEGHFWLNEDTNRPALGWDAACIRICTWGHFRDVKTGKDFYFLNLHLDHVGVVARRESAKLVIERINELTKGGKKPIVLTGDFNVSQHDEVYQLFSNSGILKDCYEAAANRFAECGTFNSFNPEKYTTDRIDHIFVSPKTDVEAYAVLTDGRWRKEDSGKMKRRNISDHYPVFARIRF